MPHVDVNFDIKRLSVECLKKIRSQLEHLKAIGNRYIDSFYEVDVPFVKRTISLSERHISRMWIIYKC